MAIGLLKMVGVFRLRINAYEIEATFFALIFLLSSIAIGANRECNFYLVDFNKPHLACLRQHIAAKAIAKNSAKLKSLKFGKRYLVIGIKAPVQL